MPVIARESDRALKHTERDEVALTEAVEAAFTTPPERRITRDTLPDFLDHVQGIATQFGLSAGEREQLLEAAIRTWITIVVSRDVGNALATNLSDPEMARSGHAAVFRQFKLR